MLNPAVCFGLFHGRRKNARRAFVGVAANGISGFYTCDDLSIAIEIFTIAGTWIKRGGGFQRLMQI